LKSDELKESITMPKTETPSWISWLMAEPKEAIIGLSARQNQWCKLIDEIIPPDTRIVWDPGEGRLVRVPKAKWK
jgi:hypothetical protein